MRRNGMQRSEQLSDSINIPDELAHLVAVSARKIATVLAENREGKPTILKHESAFPEDVSTIETRYTEISAYAHAIRQLRERLFGLPSVQRAVRGFVEMGIADKPGLQDSSGTEIENPTFEQWGPVIAQKLFSVIGSYFDSEEQLIVDEVGLLHVLEDYVQAWHSSTIEVIAVAPLTFFESDTEKCELSRGVQLSRFTSEEKAEWWNEIIAPTSMLSITYFDMWEFRNASHKLEARWEIPVCQSVSTRKAEMAFRQIVTGLRLSGSGGVGAPACLVSTSSRSHPGRQRSVGTLPVCAATRRVPSTSQLNSEEVPSLVKIVADIAQIEASGKTSLPIALRWFNRVYSTRHPEDAIVFLAIALESSVLADVREELKFRLRLRTAALLGGTDGREAFSTLSQMYDARSAIVHAGSSYSELARTGKIDGQLVEKTIAIVRKVLWILVQRAASGEEQAASPNGPDMDLEIVDRLTQEHDTPQ
jgi:hypothetical protein